MKVNRDGNETLKIRRSPWFIWGVLFSPLLLMLDIYARSPESEIGEIIYMSAVCYCIFAPYWIWIEGKQYIIEERGCTVKLLFIKRFYPWEKLKTKRIVDSTQLICGQYYYRCVVFSKKKKYREPMLFSPEWSAVPRRFSHIVIGLVPKEYNKKYMNAIDEELFYEKMEQWGVTLEKTPYHKSIPPLK